MQLSTCDFCRVVSSVSTIDAVDGFAMYAHCGAPRSKLASQPLGNATMAGAMSHP